MQQPSVQMISVWQMRLLLKNVLGGKIGVRTFLWKELSV